MDKRNRLGIPGITKLAGNKFAELSKEFLNDSDFTAWQTDGEVRGFIAHNYPDDTWESIIGFKPNRDFYSQVTVGLAVEPGETPYILAKMLICRDKCSDFCKIVWRTHT